MPFPSSGPRRRLRAAAVLAAALAAVLASPGAAHAQPSTWSSAFNNLTAQTRTDWMGQVPAATSLGAMSLPGTHDTLAIHGGSLLPASYETQENQGDSAATLTTQLGAGIRAIDIRVRVSSGAFVIHHTNIYQNANFDDVLTKAQSFLTAHPTETIAMDLHSECDANSSEGGSGSSSIGHCADDPATITQADRIAIFKTYLAKYPGLFYAPTVTGTTTAAMPTLGQARGHIVLTDFTGPFGGIYTGYGLTQMTTGNWSQYVENDYSQCNLATKWSEIQTNLVNANNDTSGALYTSYLSANCSPFGANPGDMAGGYSGGTGENQRLLDYLNAGNAPRTGIVKMDFPGYAVVTAVINRNPGVTFTGVIRSGIAGKCLDAYNNGNTNGTVVDLYTCNGSAAQIWTPEPDGTLRINGLCLDVAGAATATGTKVQLWTCNGGANQRWTAVESGALIGAQSGLCLDDPNSTTTDLTQLQIWTCNNTAAQVWPLP
jgi:1-phosphatidylinositol phosphodiesterase